MSQQEKQPTITLQMNVPAVEVLLTGLRKLPMEVSEEIVAYIREKANKDIEEFVATKNAENAEKTEADTKEQQGEDNA